jgi:hypothetical protein
VLEGQDECRDDEDDADDKGDLACMPLAATPAAASSWRTALAESPPKACSCSNCASRRFSKGKGRRGGSPKPRACQRSSRSGRDSLTIFASFCSAFLMPFIILASLDGIGSRPSPSNATVCSGGVCAPLSGRPYRYRPSSL